MDPASGRFSPAEAWGDQWSDENLEPTYPTKLLVLRTSINHLSSPRSRPGAQLEVVARLSGLYGMRGASFSPRLPRGCSGNGSF